MVVYGENLLMTNRVKISHIDMPASPDSTYTNVFKTMALESWVRPQQGIKYYMTIDEEFFLKSWSHDQQVHD